MKRPHAAIYLLIISVVLLSACAPAATPPITVSKSTKVAVSTEAATAAVVQGTSAVAELNTSYENAVALQLLLGTLELQGTDLAVTAEQAGALLPLWNNFKTISSSMTPRQGQGYVTPQPQDDNAAVLAQMEALVQQIQAVMTSEQIKAIAEMKITRETAMTIMQEQGITLGDPQLGRGNNAGNGNLPPQGTPPAGRPGDISGNGGPGAPPNGQQPGNGQMPAPRAGGGMISPELVDALIQMLEKGK
ncbi:hypothetical protein TFLX_01193 [Thermoflexales bacterium]|nr:hypothetical protein TFLX_01193 [Thermoflexales bacterium]